MWKPGIAAPLNCYFVSDWYLTGLGLEALPAGKQISVTGLPGDAKSADHHKKAGLIPTYCGHSEMSLV